MFLKKQVYLIFMIIFCLTPYLMGEDTKNPVLLGGFAQINITPTEPVHMSGYAGRKELSQGIHDSLFARICVFKSGADQLVVVSSDLIGFYNGSFEYIQNRLLEKFKLKPSQLFLSAIHTHAGPQLTVNEADFKNNLNYTRGLGERLISGLQKAYDSLIPVKWGVGVGSSPIAANRRELRFDGSGSPKGELIKLGQNVNGPVDREVQVINFKNQADSNLALLFNYACHATSLGSKNLIISGDFIGLCEQFVEKISAAPFMAAGIVGASGNLNPWFRALQGFNLEPGWIPETELMGIFLGEEIVRIQRSIGEYQSSVEIESQFCTVELPGKETGHYEPTAEAPNRSLNLTIAKFGEVAFVGLGGEVLTEIGLSIKAGSPFKHTFVFTHCNGAAGYLAHKEIFAEGGYEVIQSEFGPAAAEMVVKKVLDILYEMN